MNPTTASPLSVSAPAWFAWAVFSVLGKTWRYSYEGDRTKNPIFNDVKGTIFSFWHHSILQFAHGYRNRGVITVVSSSRDGDLATAIARHWGQGTIRGSSTRGGMAAARQCIAALHAGNNIAIIPDGPRGPREKAKDGVAQVALLAKAPVVPVSTRVSRSWRLNSWDRFVIPKPGASICFTFHPVIEALIGGSREGAASAITARLQKALAP